MSEIGKKGFQAICTYQSGGRLGALIRLSQWGRIKMHRPALELSPEDLAALETELGLL